MPTLIFLAIAYQIQNKKWRFLFLTLAAVNLIFNICNHAWLQEFYSATIIILLFMLNPYFVVWWQNRNMRNNPLSFRIFLNETYLIAKLNKLKLFYWFSALVVSIVAVVLYTRYTGYILLGWLLAIFLIIYISKKLFYSILSPEWFLHDVNTGYVFLSIIISWAVAYLMDQQLGDNFITPMTLAVIICLIGFHQIRSSTHFLIPGCALILSDIIWQVIRHIQNDMGYTPQVVTAECVLISAMLVGLIWLIKKPGIPPIAYLALFQLFRFSSFAYQAIYNAISNALSAPEVTYYILYLVSWMYIVPLLFWLIGLMHQEPETNQKIEKHTDRFSKFLASHKKDQA